MTRAQMYRAAREKDKLARSGKYGNIGINPNPGPSRNKAGDSGMTVGAMLRSALSGGASKTGYRELEVLEENHIAYDRDHLVVPWDFLAEYGRHAAKVERKLPSWEAKEIQGGYVRQIYDTIGERWPRENHYFGGLKRSGSGGYRPGRGPFPTVAP